MAYRSFSEFGFSLTPWVKRLLIANTAVFLITFVLARLGFPIIDWLAFQPGEVLFRPWTLITYMFVHGGLLHLFFNMLALFFFGPPLEQQWGSKEFLKYYLICGLGGVVASFLFEGAVLIGASAAVYGVMLAFAMNWPNSPIYIWGIFPVKAKYLVGFFFLLSLFYAFGNTPGGVSHFAHLGGFIAGFAYLKLDRPRTGASKPGQLDRLRRMVSRPRLTVMSGGAAPPRSESSRRRVDDDRMLDELDRVLDKISAQGMDSLTAEERRVLDEASRRFRQN